MTTSKIRLWLVIQTLACYAAVAHAQSSDYPQRPIRLVVPFAAGGGIDVSTRAIIPAWGNRIKGTFIVDNKPGAGGTIAAADVARSPGDGYTVMMTLSDPVVNAVALFKSLPYDPARDFKYITKSYETGTMIVIGASAKISNLRDMLAEAKKESGRITYGSFGPGSNPQLVFEALAKEAGVKFTEVAYKGLPPGLQDALSGRIHMVSSSAGVFAALAAAGKVVPLALTGDKRSALLPNVPTFKEAGFNGFLLGNTTWVGLIGPASISNALAERLADSLRAAMQEPELQKMLSDRDLNLVASTPAEFDKAFRAEYAVIPRMMRDDLKIVPQ